MRKLCCVKLCFIVALFVVMFLTGCPAEGPKATQADDPQLQAKIEVVKGKKLVNVQVDKQQAIFVMEDGTLFTVYVVHPHRTSAYIGIK
jgi:outer membrane biogenesis lipoprotein LolB